MGSSFERADPAAVAAAVTRVAGLGGYFGVGVGAAPPLPTPLRELPADQLRARAEATCARLGSGEFRVGASTWQFGIMARLWSVILGCWATAGVLPDLDTLALTDTGLVLGSPGGWLDRGARPSEIADRAAGQVLAVTEPLHDRWVGELRMARGLLDGNRASAAVGAVTALVRAGALRDPESLLGTLLDHPVVAEHLQADSGRGPMRRSCCLFYRVPATGSCCGDCPVTPPRWERRPARPPRR
ncbi:MAG: (2Fe-2S)-binding protein [Propionibacteriaceae bacterium]|nr:(2Fe-2S)-binding protein [Propionibacteriaceae bacterium]